MSDNIFRQDTDDAAVSQDGQTVAPIPIKPRVCNLVWLQLGCVAMLILVGLFGLRNTFVILGVLLLMIPFVGIAALIRISFKSPQLKGRVGAFFMIAISGYLIFNMAYFNLPRARHFFRGNCSTNLHGLGIALQVYVNDYDGVLPVEGWCDRLIEEADVSPESFTCPKSDTVEGESDYCMNQYAAGKKMAELPPDMVLLFECTFVPAQNETRQPIRNRASFNGLMVTKKIFDGDEEVYLDRWNQVGGPELLAFDRHQTGCFILFADGRTEFVELSRLPDLRWDVEGKIKFALPEIPQAPKISGFYLDRKLIVLAAAVLIVTCAVLWRFAKTRYVLFLLALGVLSAATGFIFGSWSQAAYMADEEVAGGYAGIYFGLLVGLSFAAMLTGTLERTKHVMAFRLLSCSTGMIAGVLCSTLVHLTLMIVQKETNAYGIVIGIPYGIFAGAMLGLISGAIVNKVYRKIIPVQGADVAHVNS